MSRIKWSQEMLKLAQKELRKQQNLKDVAETLTSLWDEAVTPKKIEKAFARHHLPTAAQVIRRNELQASDQTEKLLRLVQTGKGKTFEELCNRLDLSPKACKQLVKRTQQKGYDIQVHANVVLFEDTTIGREAPPVQIADLPGDAQKPMVFAAISDTHFGNEKCAVAELQAFINYAYDVHGVRMVLHAGDMLDGELHRGSKYELDQLGYEDQAKAALEGLPQRDGMEYHFITGNHDYNTYWKAVGMDPGKGVVLRGKEMGREDLHHHGQISANLTLGKGKNAIRIELAHPKMSNAYAKSYHIQKWVERYEGGDKPHITIMGHLHSYTVLEERNVVAMQPGCFCWQTPFLKERKLTPAVGGAIVWVWRDGNGFRFRHEWCRWWPKGQEWVQV